MNTGMGANLKIYLAAAFGMTAATWGVLWILSSFGAATLKDAPALYALYLLGGFSPTIASYMSERSSRRDLGFSAWLKEIFVVRQSLGSWLLVVALLIIYAVPIYFFGEFELGAPLFLFPILIPAMLLGGGLEEVGWRTVLQPELEKKLPFIPATIITAAIWGVWHVPLFYIIGAAQRELGSNPLIFMITTFGMAFALAVINKITGKIFYCLLFHCAINACLSTFVLVKESWAGAVISSALLIVVSLFVYYGRQKRKIF